jgi:copper homeostasis protein
MTNKKNPLLEICCYTVESVRIAAKAGAHRVELCTDKFTGGGSPTGAMLLEAKKFNIPVNVMLHTREGNYNYDTASFEALKIEMELMKTLGADGLVFGVTNDAGEIDKQRTAELVKLAYPLDITFHRAMDEMKDPLKALDDLISLGIPRVLTSGTKKTALEGREILRELSKRANGRISIMAGGSVRASNIETLFGMGIHEFHTSALTDGTGIASEKEIENTLQMLKEYYP